MDNAAFERDVLLTFLIGLRDELQRKVMQSEGSSLEDFLQEAISLEGSGYLLFAQALWVLESQESTVVN